MRKTLSAVALLLLLATGVVVNGLRPAPNVDSRSFIGEATGVETSLGTLTYIRSGNGPCVILLPTAGREASDFNELVSSLNSKGYHTAVLTNGDINKSSHNLAQNFYDAGFTLEIVSTYECRLKPVVLVGHGYGNMVARNYAMMSNTMGNTDVSLLDHPTEPADVRGVILLTSTGQVPVEPEIKAALESVFNPLRPYRSRMKDVRYAFFADGNEIPDYWKRGWHTKTAIAQAKAVANNADDESWYCAGGVPMLIVQPMQDRIAPIENAYALKEKCPQEVEIVEVQNAGHALLPEQPEAVAQAVLDFLAKHHPTDKNEYNPE